MSQGSLNVPTTGPVSPTAMAGDMNTAYDALVSKNSGGSAPANFPTSPGAPTTYQEWADTSPGASITDLKVYDGSNWLPTGSMDGVNHVWMPKVGGNSDTIASAATVDVGSKRSGYITITGSVPGTPITSFGSNALLTTGETKFIRFAAAGILTYNAASMILPGAADLPFNAGDTLQALYLGAGNWLAYDFRSNISPNGRNTGDMFMSWNTAAITGSVRANGGTMGNGASGGTERANADTVNLFISLYLSDTTLAVSGGRTAPGNTRAAAITDYNLNKTITLPDMRLNGSFTETYTLSTGTGSYATPANATALKIREKAAGGGGGAAVTNAGTAGTDTSFNGVVAKGGSGGAAGISGQAPPGGIGGTGGAGSASFRLPGSAGGWGYCSNNSFANGGMGAPGLDGNGAGAGGVSGAAGGNNGSAAGTNTGAGGGGAAGAQNAFQAGGGGGSGEELVLFILGPSGSYAFAVGVGGPGGAAGTKAGGAGADGVILVTAYFGMTYLAL